MYHAESRSARLRGPSNAGAYVVDANTGKVIWRANREDDPRWIHAHMGWAADIWEESPGMEMLTNRDGHLVRDTVLVSADGTILMNRKGPAGPGEVPIVDSPAIVRKLRF